jgi:phosphoglycerate dehydrogenase-like enzyme
VTDPKPVPPLKAWIPEAGGVDLLGAVPTGVTVEVYDREFPSDPAGVRFWVPPFLATDEVTATAARLPDLEVVQLMTAGAEVWTDRVPAGVTLCDARGVHDSATSEWVLAAVLASVRGFVEFGRAQAEGRWAYTRTDELAGKRVLIVGAGSVGGAVVRRLEPFDVTVTQVARRARDGVHVVAELPDLLPAADVVVLLVPLTDATRGLVDADFLARLHDGALLVNGARGPVVDTDALVAELASGRIRAAVDVTDPEPLPAGHPLWDVPGLLLTPHVGGSVPGLRRRAFGLVGEQLRRYVAGERLENVVADGY